VRSGPHGDTFSRTDTAVIIVILVVGAAASAAVIIFLTVAGKGHPHEETAKLFPSDTQIYFSLNLSPGNDQLRDFRDIIEQFREHPDFQRKIDDWLDKAEAEVGINLKLDVLPWLGPEIGIGLVDVVGSSIAIGTGGGPLVLALIDTKDSEKAETALQKLMQYLEHEESLVFDKDSYRGSTVYSEDRGDQHYAITTDYVLFATDLDLLEETIDRIEDGDSAGTLYAESRFQEARGQLPGQRFSMLYIDAKAVWLDARRQFGDELPGEIVDQLNDAIPAWLTLTGSFIDKGVKLTMSATTPEDASFIAPLVNSLGSTRLLPWDTNFFASIAFEPDLEPLRETLESQSIDELGPDFYDALNFEFGLVVDPDGTFGDVLDAALDRFEDLTGLNLERDLLGWMTGEISLALLPTDFEALSQDPAFEPIEALAMIQFDPERLDDVTRAVDVAVQLLEDNLDLQADSISYGGGQGATFDIQEVVGPTAYLPGYLILDEHLIIATTGDALKLTGATSEGQEDSLAGKSKFARGVKDLSDATNPLVYVNLGEIVDAVVQSLDEDDLREYREDVEPFIGPLGVLLLGGEAQESVSSVTITLTLR
jgi:hypothetical protein